MKMYTDVIGNQHVVAVARLVEPLGYGRSMRIIVNQCPYCGRTHHHSYSEELQTGVYGKREADCFQGQYLLVDEDVVDAFMGKVGE